MTRKYIAVTGCCGFIGRVVATKLLERGDFVYGVDALTYAADPAYNALLHGRFGGAPHASYCFVGTSIGQLGRWPDVDAIVHLAAETHVDNSLSDSARFVETNVNGTLHLLEMTRAKSQHGMPKFIHISTDEVYGPIKEGKATTESQLAPTSPYAASKAAADLLVRAWGETFDLPYSIIRPTNCYGRGQYPEKLIPKTVRSQMLGRPMTIHGDGSMTRQWLYVEDLCDAILLVLDKDLPGIWNVGGNTEASVRSVVEAIGGAYTMGYERPACDQRYSVDDTPIRNAGWNPVGDFWRDLPELVQEERGRFRF